MKRNLALWLLCLVFSAQVFAGQGTGIAELIKSYQYSVLVEWDQQDPEFLKAKQDDFARGIETLIAEGHKPRELLQESLKLIPNEEVRRQLSEASQLSGSSMTSEELTQYFEQQLNSMTVQGSSWSPVTKILLGVAITYVVLKVLMITLMYWDTDPNYGQVDNPPKVP